MLMQDECELNDWPINHTPCNHPDHSVIAGLSQKHQIEGNDHGCLLDYPCLMCDHLVPCIVFLPSGRAMQE